jgi:hypothetical protein
MLPGCDKCCARGAGFGRLSTFADHRRITKKRRSLLPATSCGQYRFLEANSQQRAEQGRTLIAQVLGSLVGEPVIEARTVAQLRASGQAGANDHLQTTNAPAAARCCGRIRVIAAYSAPMDRCPARRSKLSERARPVRLPVARVSHGQRYGATLLRLAQQLGANSDIQACPPARQNRVVARTSLDDVSLI